MTNSKVLEIYNYINEYRNIDSGYWYEGSSSIGYYLSAFDDKDISDLIVSFNQWEPDLLKKLAQAVTARYDPISNQALGAFIYGNILLNLNTYHVISLMDDFDFLLNSDIRNRIIIQKLQIKLETFDFANYDKVALKQWRELCVSILDTLK